MGTQPGADMVNLDNIQGLGARIASNSGAGRFDGVFLVGIVAVLLASLIQPPKASYMTRFQKKAGHMPVCRCL